MRVAIGKNVDLITPFPVNELPRIYNWIHCFKSIAEHDLSPKDPEEFLRYARLFNEHALMYGIIDKNNLTKSKDCEAPIVGMINFEANSPFNAYAHIAASRRAGRSYKYYGVSMIDEAAALALDDIFELDKGLLRVSVAVLERNAPVLSLVKRIGFKREGTFDHWITQEGQPQSIVHLGMTRAAWEARKTPQLEVV